MPLAQHLILPPSCLVFLFAVIRFSKEDMLAMHKPSERPQCMEAVPPNLVAAESLPPSTSLPIDLDQIFAEWSQQRQERRGVMRRTE